MTQISQLVYVLTTFKLVLRVTVWSSHPLLSGQFSLSWKLALLITVILTSNKGSPLLSGHCHHLWSPNGSFSVILTCIRWSHGVNYLFIQFQIMLHTRYNNNIDFLVYFCKSLKCCKQMFLIWGQMSDQHWRSNSSFINFCLSQLHGKLSPWKWYSHGTSRP